MKNRILIIDDEVAIHRSFGKLFEAEGFAVDVASNAGEAIEIVQRQAPDVAICDIRLPDKSGIEVLDRLRLLAPMTIVIMMTAHATADNAVEALKLGASDYLHKPIMFDDLLHRVQHLLAHRRLEWEAQFLRRSVLKRSERNALVGESRPIRRVRELIQKVAATPTTVLITGESGSGKDLIASEIHKQSKRADGPFLAINCSAIPDSLLESELFGYRKGAFSGADADKDGILSLAQGGTLLMDEIGDLPLALQPKLLRAMESKEFMPLGATSAVRVDTRLIAATNRSLEKMVEAGSFRQDLYFRISFLEIRAPSLRDCAEDIPLLVDYFLDRLNHELDRAIKGVEASAMAKLERAPWPGNVRELENRLRRAMILSNADFLTEGDLWGEDGGPGGGSPLLKDAVRRFEAKVIRGALDRNEGDKRLAAEELGVSVATLYAKLRGFDAASSSDGGTDPDDPQRAASY